MEKQGKRRGVVLIVVLGVLAVLALLATTFATLQATERLVSRNYLDMVRAKLLAQSGVQDALARLKDQFPFRAFDANPAVVRAWRYYGGQVDETQAPIPAPLEKAKNPSFACEVDRNPTNPDSSPQLLNVGGASVGLSGAHESGTYTPFGDHYALRVTDLSGCVYVNDGLDGDTPGNAYPQNLGSVSLNLRRILNTLGTVVLNDATLGDKILSARGAGYAHKVELWRALSPAEFEKIRDFLTVNAWVDRNVANPVPLSQALVDYEKSQGNALPENYGKVRGGLYRFGRSKDAAGNEIVPAGGLNTCPPIAPTADPAGMPAACVYGLDTLNPQWIEIVSRAPVNVNAAPLEVLVALLADLKGFFLTDRKRNNPRWSGFKSSVVLARQNTHSPARSGEWMENYGNFYVRSMSEGDEYGYLFQTSPLVGPGSTSSGISSFDVARHIIACRDRAATSGASVNFDYGAAQYKDDDGVMKPLWWSGPFRNWTQFNTFVDHLVTIGLLKDPRSDFVDYPLNSSVETMGYSPTLVSSTIQGRHAARAIADVLKANFNPNLHLNETNPDANLHLIVDKTDLIVNSTEFCFLATGMFEIESLGRVVRQTGGGADAFAGENELIAQAKVVSVVKLYDLSRETNQKQFAAGFAADPGPPAGTDTSNGRTVEVGPEPEDGKGFGDKEWGGYVALPTMGGASHGVGPRFVDALHVHFNPSFDAHYSIIGAVAGQDARLEIAGRTLPGEKVENYPDLPGLPGGPYPPLDGAGNEHRLARSFRNAGGTMSLPTFAPSDLRIDGGYSERHSAPSYYTSTSGGSIWDFKDLNLVQRGTVSFWMKPSFDPERTGKMRQAWDLSRYHDYCSNFIHVYPLAMWFFPTHTNEPAGWESSRWVYAVREPEDDIYAVETFAQIRSCSLTFGSVSYHVPPGPGTVPPFLQHGFGTTTTSLNHVGHADEALQPNFLRGHRWVHVTLSWDCTSAAGYYPGWMFVNGRDLIPDTEILFADGSGTMLHFDRHDNGTPHVYDGRWAEDWPFPGGTGDYNHMRLGGVSKIADAAVVGAVRHYPDETIIPGAYRGNHSADATLDEFTAWRGSVETNPFYKDAVWGRGRYYKPAAGEAVFTSQPLQLPTNLHRFLAPASNVSPPGGGALPPGTAVADPPIVRVLGFSWTWYGEGVDAAGRRTLYDYDTPDGRAGADVQPQVRLSLQDPNIPPVFYDNDGFSAVRAVDGSTPALQNPAQVKYRAEFRLQNANVLNTKLLATPVLDDVTIYWDLGCAETISYIYDNRSL